MPGALPDRTKLEHRRERDLVRGGPTKADVWLARLPGGEGVVVKDFARKSWLVRVWGRLQNRRERRFLTLLEATGHVPRSYGALDRDALVVEYVEGRGLWKCKAHPGRARLLAQLRAALDQFHALGVVHNDLRGRENVHVDLARDRIVVLDWAGALQFDPRSPLGRRLLRAATRVDEAAFLKWKVMLAPEALTAEDRSRIARFRRWRMLWPFNRKGLGRPGADV